MQWAIAAVGALGLMSVVALALLLDRAHRGTIAQMDARIADSNAIGQLTQSNATLTRDNGQLRVQGAADRALAAANQVAAVTADQKVIDDAVSLATEGSASDVLAAARDRGRVPPVPGGEAVPHAGAAAAGGAGSSDAGGVPGASGAAAPRPVDRSGR